MSFQDLSGEEWRPIKEYAGIYEVSNKGHVRRLVNSKSKPLQTPLLRKAYFNSCGYVYVRLSKKGVSKNWAVHRLVACAFLGDPPSDKSVVNHLDGYKTNCCVENLEWTTQKLNIRHAYEMGLRHAKLTDNQVREIRWLASTDNYTHKTIAKQFNISRGFAGRIIRGENYAHVTGKSKSANIDNLVSDKRRSTSREVPCGA